MNKEVDLTIHFTDSAGKPVDLTNLRILALERKVAELEHKLSMLQYERLSQPYPYYPVYPTPWPGYPVISWNSTTTTIP